jgi:hypothetical protein
MNYLIDDIGTVVASLRGVIADPNAKGAGAPYYMFGHRLDISNDLRKKSEDKVYKYQKYPLIALNMDFPEEIIGDMIHYTINIGIFMMTDKGYSSAERYTNVFKPVLYPLYEQFFIALRNSGLFSWDGNIYRPRHTKIDRPFWGKTGTESNTAELFSDPLDAIEIINLKVSQRVKC